MRRALAALALLAATRAAAVPETPGGLTTRAGDGWAVVAWSAGGDEFNLGTTSYLLWRSDDLGSTFSQAGTVYADTSSPQTATDTRGFWDRALTNGTTFTYKVTALSGTLMTSADSATVAVTPATTTVLGDPSFQAGLLRDRPVLFEAGNGYVRFLWNQTASFGESEVSEYRIWRAATPADPYTLISSGVPNGGTYTDTGLPNGTPFWYMIFASGPAGPAAPVRCPALVRAVPYLPVRGTGFPLARTDPSGPRAVRLDWEQGIAGTYGPVAAYQIYRSDDGGATLVLLDTVPAGQHFFVDLTVPTYGKRYLYIIRPVDSQGNRGDAYPTILIDVVLPVNRTYPSRNGFRPGRGESVNVIYQITEPGRVRVSVMTPTGETVRRLLETTLEGAFTSDTPFNSRDRGAPPLVWDGTNDRGEVVASGAYLVVLEIGRSRDFRAVAVIR